MRSLLPTEAWEFGLADVARGIRAAFRSRNKPEYFNVHEVGDCIAVRSGRAGIVLALQALKLRKDAVVGVPLYCCPVVFKAIRLAGYNPCFIDEDPENFCLSPRDLEAKVSKLDALIAAHMFGNVCDMPGLIRIMGEKPIIEDCAQAFGSRLNGRIAGSFGNISMFSFRSGKYISVGEGGALCSKDPDLLSRIRELVKAMPDPGRGKDLRHVIETYVRSKLRSQPLWGWLGFPIWSLYNKKTAFVSKSPIAMGRIFSSDFDLAEHRLGKLDYMIKIQRANAGYYLKNLEVGQDSFCLERPGAFYNRFMFPVKLRSQAECDYVSRYLLRNKISTSRPYRDVIEGAALNYGYKGDCPVAEQLLNSTLVIPVHYKVRKSDLEYVARRFNKAWGDIRSA